MVDARQKAKEEKEEAKRTGGMARPEHWAPPKNPAARVEMPLLYPNGEYTARSHARSQPSASLFCFDISRVCDQMTTDENQQLA